jgi:hypothetical protein
LPSKPVHFLIVPRNIIERVAGSVNPSARRSQYHTLDTLDRLEKVVHPKQVSGYARCIHSFHSITSYLAQRLIILSFYCSRRAAEPYPGLLPCAL